MELGNLHVGQTFFQQPAAEGLLHVVFAVDDEECLYFFSVLAGLPSEKLSRSGGMICIAGC